MKRPRGFIEIPEGLLCFPICRTAFIPLPCILPFPPPSNISRKFSMERSADPLTRKSEPCAVGGERLVSPSPDREETPDRTEIPTSRIALQKAASKHSDQIPCRKPPL